MPGTRGRIVVGAAVLVLLAGGIWVSGGLARADQVGPTSAAPGVEVEATPFRVRLDSAEATYELSDGSTADEGLAYVVVAGTLALDDDESVGSDVLGDAFRADLSTYDVYGEPQDEAEPIVTVAGDGSWLLGIGPGLTYDVRLVFEVDESAVPGQVTVDLAAHVRRASSLDGTIGWHDPAVVSRVTLDVSPLPAERPDEDLQ